MVLYCYEFVTLMLLFHFLLYTCHIGYLASESPLVWERASDSVCHVSFGCGSFCAVRPSLVILWAGFGI